MFKKICLFALILTGFIVQHSLAQSISIFQAELTDSLSNDNPVHTLRPQKNVSAHSVRFRRHGDEHHHGLHFAHPLFTESVSPDTKFRFNYTYQNLADDITRNGLVLGGEYAFDRSFSVEVGLLYEFLNPEIGSSESRLGNMELSFKFANYAYEDAGLLMG